MDRKRHHDCPTPCGHPNVNVWADTLTPARQKVVDAIQGESKEIMYCGHCNTLWVEFRLNQNDYTTGYVWFKKLRVENMQTNTDKWLI